jgi:hypothetical protein
VLVAAFFVDHLHRERESTLKLILGARNETYVHKLERFECLVAGRQSEIIESLVIIKKKLVLGVTPFFVCLFGGFGPQLEMFENSIPPNYIASRNAGCGWRDAHWARSEETRFQAAFCVAR